MGFDQRDYSRDYQDAQGGPFMRAVWWVLSGSVHLFTIFGIRVRIFVNLLVVIALMALIGGGDPTNNLISAVILFSIILLHELGHCFGAWWTGGEAKEITLGILGGLAYTYSANRPWPRFITVAAGPAVNVIICIICGIGLYITSGFVPLGPWQFGEVFPKPGFASAYIYLFWIYTISYALLVFNMLPIFPLDGGQLLQAILWKQIGYYKSMMAALNVSIAGASIVILLALAGGRYFGGLLTVLIMFNCLLTSVQLRAMMRAQGPWAFQEEDEVDYAASLRDNPHKPGFFEKRREKKEQVRQQAEAQAQQNDAQRLDQILAKISKSGRDSLTRSERKFLEETTKKRQKSGSSQPRG